MYEILCWNTALTEEISSVVDIINYIKGFLNKENTIAILQQIPFTGHLIRKTCIDHVFVRRELVTRCSNVVVHEDISYSDHYPITFTYHI